MRRGEECTLLDPSSSADNSGRGDNKGACSLLDSSPKRKLGKELQAEMPKA